MNSAQKKIEEKIMDCITAFSAGRLVVFKPEKSDITLVVVKKGNYENNSSVILDIYGSEKPGGKSLEELAEFASQNSISRPENTYCVFSFFDIVKQDIEESIWLIPAFEVEQFELDRDLSKFLVSQKDFVKFLLENV